MKTIIFILAVCLTIPAYAAKPKGKEPPHQARQVAKQPVKTHHLAVQHKVIATHVVVYKIVHETVTYHLNVYRHVGVHIWHRWGHPWWHRNVGYYVGWEINPRTGRWCLVVRNRYGKVAWWRST